VGIRETNGNEPLETHRNSMDDIRTGVALQFRESMRETCLLLMRCPVYRPEFYPY
jgi:hypothetical protein